MDDSPQLQLDGQCGLARVVLTSGNLQAYEDPGTHIFQELHPDIAMIQEFNVGDNAPATIHNWVAA
jgi:hypothetical protein